MMLLDLEAYARRAMGSEHQHALKSARRWASEARLLRDELLARGERDVATMLTHTLKQLNLANAS